MAFIGQIRLEEAAPLDISNLLPPKGILFFFYDARQETYGEDLEEKGGWQVIFYEGDLSLCRPTSFPSELIGEARFTDGQVSFSNEITLPSSPELDLAGKSWSEEETRRYEDFLVGLTSTEDRALPHHRMLGHPDQIQEDMRIQCALVSNGVTDLGDSRANALISSARNWELLLQVDSDESLGMKWASAGRLYYWIEREALLARQFERTWLVLQSD